MNYKIDDLKNNYNNIEIPKELDECIKIGIEKGKTEMKKNKVKRAWIKGVASSAAVFTIFTISINTIPTFANSIIDVPALGKLVQVLQFNKGTASGGTVTDGADIKTINLEKNETGETITIGISKDNINADIAPHFKVDYTKNPYTMTFTISGARKLSAEKYFDTLKQNKFVEDAYKLITLDDSMIRFNVVFKNPVKFEVKEYKEPAQIVVNLFKDNEASSLSVYSVRTLSMTNGEGIASMEERFGIGKCRVLKDEKGTFLIEAGNFESESLAKEKIEELSKMFKETKFYIEKRNSMDTPKVIVK